MRSAANLRLSLPAVSLALSFALALVGPDPARAQVDTIFVVPGAHFDVGFDDLPSVVHEHRIKAVEDALAAAEADSDFHWMEDGAWGFGGWLKRYRDDPVRLARARRALASGQLVVSAAWVSPHGAMFHESLDLLTAHLDEMARVFGCRPQVAVLDDVPSQPEALVDALARHGVRYLLIGANLFISPPLPEKLVRSPFWWESSKGARVLAYVDPNSYGQALAWPAAQDTMRFADAVRDPMARAVLAAAERGFRQLLVQSPSRYDALVFEHAGDDLWVSAAQGIPQLVRLWDSLGLRPSLKLASPLEYFRHVEARYGSRLPVYRGEWGGEWDQIRSACPVWTWRVREAMRRLRPDATTEVREALATAMDHGLTLGPGWPDKLTEPQTIAHAREQADLFARSVKSIGPSGATLVDSVPRPASLSSRAGPDPRWRDLLADPATIRVRSGRGRVAPFITDAAPRWDVPLSVETCGTHARVRARIDRRAVPRSESTLVFVTLEVPLRAPADRLRLVPADSRSARSGLWLRGAPPAFVVAPEGVRVTGLAHELRVSSPLAFSYTLVSDQARPSVTWLQILLARVDRNCTFRGGTTKVMSYEELYPGEPPVLDTWVDLDLRR